MNRQTESRLVFHLFASFNIASVFVFHPSEFVLTAFSETFENYRYTFADKYAAPAQKGSF